MAVITVSQLNNYLKRYLDQNPHLNEIWIKGEISNFKKHYSGHMYFTLKDDESSLKTVIFKGNASAINFIPKDGMKVLVFGRISVYEAAGTYQLYVNQLIPDGIGELYAAFEQLKTKLQAQGLFDESNKNPLPLFPKRIGVVTSISGAALRDILNVLKRRYPIADVCIYPAQVQGVGAADSICEALTYFDTKANVDVIILARGGGSIEDLWSFNEEKTARAIFNCTIPVISGVGHETDFTISDFVADKRAPTPSAAAEIAVPSIADIKLYCRDMSHTLYRLINNHVNNLLNSLTNINSERFYLNISSKIKMYKLETENAKLTLARNFENRTNIMNSEVMKLISKLEVLNPSKVLERGYAIVCDSEGNTVNPYSLSENDFVTIQFNSVKAECLVQKVVNNE